MINFTIADIKVYTMEKQLMTLLKEEDNQKMRDKLDKGKISYEEYVEWLNSI